MSQLKPGDRALIVIGIIALLACGAWLFATRLAAPSEGLVVVCQNKEGFYRADPLDAATEYVVRTEDAAEAGYNTVRIADGAVEVVEADCSTRSASSTTPSEPPASRSCACRTAWWWRWWAMRTTPPPLC